MNDRGCHPFGLVFLQSGLNLESNRPTRSHKGVLEEYYHDVVRHLEADKTSRPLILILEAIVPSRRSKIARSRIVGYGGVHRVEVLEFRVGKEAKRSRLLIPMANEVSAHTLERD